MLPLIDLKKQYNRIEVKIKDAVNAVLDSGQYIMGPEVQRVEEKLAKYVGVKHCVSCASGTDALFMALLAKGVGAGSLVFTTPFTFVATAETIALTGAVPVFVDIDERTFNMDPAKLELAIDACLNKDDSLHPLPKAVLEQDLVIKGIIAVDLFGLPADYDAINAIAKKNNLFVIEDAAQSLGASYKGRKAGSLAEIGCTSFFPAKPLGVYGDGGAIFCNDEKTKEVLESIRVHGQGVNKYHNDRLGITGRFDAIQAAILNVKLDIFDEEIDARRRIAAAYEEVISGIAGLHAPYTPNGYQSVWAQFTIIAEDTRRRDECTTWLTEAEIGNSIYYPIPLHQQKAFQYLDYKAADFPVSHELSSRVFSVPMHPYLTADDIQSVVNALSGEK